MKPLKQNMPPAPSSPSGLGRQQPHGSGAGWAWPPLDGMYRGNRPAFQSHLPGWEAAAATCPSTGPEAASFARDPHRPPKSSLPLPLIPTPVSPIQPVICVTVAWGGLTLRGLWRLGARFLCVSQQPATPLSQRPGRHLSSLKAFTRGHGLGRENAKGPLWPTICCQKPKVPNQLA